jgi:hypothetical protein
VGQTAQHGDEHGAMQMIDDLTILISLIVTCLVVLGAVVVAVLAVMAGGKDK